MNQITDIITMILSIAILTLLINRAQSTAGLIQTSGATFNSILRTITLQNNSFGSGFGGGSFGGF